MAKFFRLFLAVGVIAFMGHTPLAQADNDFWLSQKIAAGAPTKNQQYYKMARDIAAPYLASGQ